MAEVRVFLFLFFIIVIFIYFIWCENVNNWILGDNHHHFMGFFFGGRLRFDLEATSSRVLEF